MSVLNWEKPKRAMPVESWKNISADSAPPGVYTPNMSKEDMLKWKAKILGAEDPRVEIRKSFHFCKPSGEFNDYGKTGGGKHPKYNNYGTQMCIVVRLDDTRQPNVLISANGKMAMTFVDMETMQQAIKESVEALKNNKKMNLVELQVKKSAAPEFKKKSLFGEKEIRIFKDGERFICYIISEQPMMGKTYYEVEDVDGTITGTICSDNFHKITNPKNFSKRFMLLKQKLHIVDKI